MDIDLVGDDVSFEVVGTGDDDVEYARGRSMKSLPCALDLAIASAAVVSQTRGTAAWMLMQFLTGLRKISGATTNEVS